MYRAIQLEYVDCEEGPTWLSSLARSRSVQIRPCWLTLDKPSQKEGSVTSRANEVRGSWYPNGAWVCIAAIRGDAVQGHAGHRPGRTKERFGCREVPRVAEIYVHEVAIAINRPVEVSPLALDTYVGFVHVLAGSDPAVTPLPQRLAEERSQLALPLPHRFMRKAEAPLEKHFR
jgi:hypothetical protein